LGHVTAIITAGVLSGILVARVGAGVIAEHFGWRAVYWVASSAMVAITLSLSSIMERRSRDRAAQTLPYRALLASLLTLLRTHREIVFSGAIQGIGFGQFIALWLGLALHLTGPRMGYGTDVVGYLAAFAAISVFTTPYWGRMADRIGPRKARIFFSIAQTAGVALLLPFGDNLWLLMIPLVLVNIVGPAIDVTSRMTFLSLDAELRTRLTTIYIVMMFIGGSIGSVIGTVVFDAFGWSGTAIYVFASCFIMTAIAFLTTRLYGERDMPATA